MQNWTCTGSKQYYQYEGWLVNATDEATGVHAGYAFTRRGQADTHLPFFVATRCGGLGGGAEGALERPLERLPWGEAACPPPPHNRPAHAGSRCLSPTHAPCSPDNATVTGTLVNVRESGSIEVPAPEDPGNNTQW